MESVKLEELRKNGAFSARQAGIKPSVPRNEALALTHIWHTDGNFSRWYAFLRIPGK